MASLSWAPLVGCRDRADRPDAAHEPIATPIATEDDRSQHSVGYDIRRLRPRNEEPLATMFERLRKRAIADGKTVAVLFSAGWCEPCQRLELEFGRRHPARAIGHIRIFELKEEDWEPVTRMDEFNALRRRWSGRINDYPLFVVLDADGAKREEMQEAIARLEDAGREPTLPTWFAELAEDAA